jgi:hypothetical protein
MNERIEKLAEQAGLWNDMEPTRLSGRYVGYMNVADVEKFAELIVRECADISDASFHNGSAGYTAILKHFGVE